MTQRAGDGLDIAPCQGNQDKKNKNGILELIGLESINNNFYRYYYEQILMALSPL